MGKLSKLFKSQQEQIFKPTKDAINLLAYRITYQFLDLSPISTGNLLSAWKIGYKTIPKENGALSNLTSEQYLKNYWNNRIRYDGSDDIDGIMKIARNDIDYFANQLDNRKITDTVYITNFAHLSNTDDYAYTAIFEMNGNVPYGAFSGRKHPRYSNITGFSNVWNLYTTTVNLK